MNILYFSQCIYLLICYFLLSRTEEGEQQQTTPNKQTQQLLSLCLPNNHLMSILQRLFFPSYQGLSVQEF